ncbi:MAG TPA: NADH:ubiquinone reductase (Na(+)-transporting) subunit D, partial [Bacteroidales bacterium]|nr:NADH:ubiquinone reductase (Na(+)-transporting) subunit D [Bacteroidales bacterium]
MSEAVIKTPKEDLFSAKYRKLLSNPMGKDNPVTIQVLG